MLTSKPRRNNLAGGDAIELMLTWKAKVRSKVEANLPASQLAVEAEEGAVIAYRNSSCSGTTW